MKRFSEAYLKKLHIGNVTIDSNVLMAPLAGYTAYPFRLICLKLGAGLAFTEMVSANGLKYNDKATKTAPRHFVSRAVIQLFHI